MAALDVLNAERDMLIRIRKVKYLNTIVEQDHRAIKRVISPMIGFKDFRCAGVILSPFNFTRLLYKAS
ncbi:transposase-like protein [Paraburkholderia fungorum]|uniref:Transposase-like protein n=1 Tax=Paraburkholderia fungorum TaxID=134537 RepID=A0AAW3UU63_9BURK|nr:transposase-like protein [Paraburkholderia fungorum]MBB6201147.1 transposase-like protein [Paraburkholderia fungorum]